MSYGASAVGFHEGICSGWRGKEKWEPIGWDVRRCREGGCRELSTEIRTQIENRLRGDGGVGSDQALREDAESERVLEGGTQEGLSLESDRDMASRLHSSGEGSQSSKVL